MILKIWNEITSTWVFVDNVLSATSNKDYCLRMEDDDSFKVITALLVYKPIGTDNKCKTADLLKGSWIPIYNATEEIKNCLDFKLSRNINSLYPVDHTFVSPCENYKDKFDLTYVAKVIIVNGFDKSEKSITYLLPDNADVFILNEHGKTIDRL